MQNREGELTRKGNGSITEGIGQGRVTENMKGKTEVGKLKFQLLLGMVPNTSKTKEPSKWFLIC
jgi:hypothetical protein